MAEEVLFGKILEIARKEKQPLDIDFVAEKLGRSWWTIYKAVFDKILTHLQAKHPEILGELEIVPVKTRKSVVLLLPEIYLKGVKAERVS
jgi:hypothetical protein